MRLDPNPRPLCIVLAAGNGTRMGTPKALLRVRATTWWKLQQSRLHAAGVDALWVVNPVVAAEFATHASPPQHTTIMPASGAPLPMFASVLHGLSMDTPRNINFILPVDVPCPLPDTFARLAGACTDGASVPARGDTTGHPLCLFGEWINRHLLTPPLPDPLTARLDDLTRPIVRRVQVEDPDAFINLNT
ncbi:MAG: nucleotidyltransferase family protein, partial [Planctomycetota bacterium]|nr:nucleotidyltransferase family protein [Planctomycetota bacterium]